MPMSAILYNYPDSLQGLKAQFDGAQRDYPATRITALARAITDGAVRLDMERGRNLGIVEKYRKLGIVRDTNNPPEIDHPDTGGGPEADDPEHPLPPGEHWNEGRRATMTGARYTLDEKGRPVNPYMNTGLQGRGMMWLYGPNFTIENGVLEIAPDENGEPALFIVGIRRKDDPQQRPAMSGGFAKYKKLPDGSYTFDEEAILETRLEEFFEEMVSDSVPLLPAYAARVDAGYEAAVKKILSRPGTILSPEHTEQVREQVVTGLKLKQVRDMDPGFLDRLKDFLAQGREAFAGPLVSSGRITNNAWIESRLRWVMLDQEKWKQIAGNGPFDYKLSGGDDAAGVVYYSVNAETIRTALPAHGPMMTWMLASFLLDAQERGVEVHPNIIRQIEEVAAFYNPPTADARPLPAPG
jgi:hypothetical protein